MRGALEDVKRRNVRFADPWEKTARANQRPPEGDWRIWALITGRGWGKNRVQAEFAHAKARELRGSAGFIAGRTLGDVGRYVVNHPESGLLVTQKPDNPCRFVQVKGGGFVVRWANGSFADVHTSDEPDRARGGHYAWGIADEVASWKRVVDFEGNTTWDNLQFGLRAGRQPQMVAGSTPRRGSKLVRWLMEEGERDLSSVRLSRGGTAENAANLSASYLEFVEGRYGGTHLGRQELDGQLLPDVEGAIVTSDMVEASRIMIGDGMKLPVELRRIAVGVDPSGGAAEQGIVAAARGVDDHAYVLTDRSGIFKPEGWGRRAVELLGQHGGDLIVAERNYGGDMVESTIRTVDRNVRVKVVTASRGKHVRFEPVGSLYEQRRVHHVGSFDQLEDEVCCFTATGYEGEASPNRADAMVWALWELFDLGEDPPEERRVGVW